MPCAAPGWPQSCLGILQLRQTFRVSRQTKQDHIYLGAPSDAQAYWLAMQLVTLRRECWKHVEWFCYLLCQMQQGVMFLHSLLLKRNAGSSIGVQRLRCSMHSMYKGYRGSRPPFAVVKGHNCTVLASYAGRP